MDSTSTSGDFESEELQEVATAASLNTATTRVQATEVQSQPVQHGGNEEDLQPHEFSQHGLASDSDEAGNGGEQANMKKDEPSPIDDFKDNASIDSQALMIHTIQQHYDYRRGSSETFAKHKQYGTKYARVAALYTEGLEIRVRTVEKELLELQYELGSKERPNEGRQVICSISFLKRSCSCSNFAVN